MGENSYVVLPETNRSLSFGHSAGLVEDDPISVQRNVSPWFSPERRRDEPGEDKRRSEKNSKTVSSH
jgi:hypothetical protein